MSGNIEWFLRQLSSEYDRKCRARDYAAYQRALEAERIARQLDRQKIAEDKIRRQLHVKARAEGVSDLNCDLNNQYFELENLLSSSLSSGKILKVNFQSLLISPVLIEEDYGSFAKEIAMPIQKKSISLILMQGFLWIPVISKYYLTLKQKAKDDFEDKLLKWSKAEKIRCQNLEYKKDNYQKTKDAELARVEAHNNDIISWEKMCGLGDPDALPAYYKHLLSLSEYPKGFPNEVEAAYSKESKLLVVKYTLPEMDVVIPKEKKFTYTKSTDTITSTLYTEKQRAERYSRLVASNTLRVLSELFRSDENKHVGTVTLNCYVKTVDRATGRRINPCLLSVRVTKDTFNHLDLEYVDPILCLKELKAVVSPSPSELLPVRPIIEFNMNDPRFISGSDILSGLDNRSNLMDLTPSEFEELITNLFQSMGLETKLTRASRDGGVDCVAYDPRPVLGGKVVVQAKRYKNTVGVSAVRDLFGAMSHERASKGILVTTSGYGKASYDFANGKPIELLDGSHLLYLLEKYTGVNAKIIIPLDDLQPDKWETD